MRNVAAAVGLWAVGAHCASLMVVDDTLTPGPNSPCVQLESAADLGTRLALKAQGQFNSCGDMADLSPVSSVGRAEGGRTVLGWEQIAEGARCEGAQGSVVIFAQDQLESPRECFAACESVPACNAIDWTCATGRCVLMESRCSTPTPATGVGAFGLETANGDLGRARFTAVVAGPELVLVRPVSGLSGSGVSLEFCLSPGSYLAQVAGKVAVLTPGSAPEDKAAATWNVLDGPSAVRLESVASPGTFLRKNGNSAVVDNQGTGLENVWNVGSVPKDEPTCAAAQGIGGMWVNSEPEGIFYEEASKQAVDVVQGSPAPPLFPTARLDSSAQVDGLSVRIGHGYKEGIDRIHADNLPDGITSIWKPEEGILELVPTEYLAHPVRHSSECGSSDEVIPNVHTPEECARACKAIAGCEFFSVGVKSQAGVCKWEKTSTAECVEGFAMGEFDFYRAGPPPPAPPTRYTESGCECSARWHVELLPDPNLPGANDNWCVVGCCNPDEDPGGEWCQPKDDNCLDNTDWERCTPLLNPIVPKVAADLTIADWETALRSLTFSTDSLDTTERKVSWNVGDVYKYSSTTGDYYKYVPSFGITYDEAKAKCEAEKFQSYFGHLATVTSAAEAEMFKGAGWLGGCLGADNVWRWCGGDESYLPDREDDKTGLSFWRSDRASPLGAESYVNWGMNEPADGERLYMESDGSWTSRSGTFATVGGYFCEFPGDIELTGRHGEVGVLVKGCARALCAADTQVTCTAVGDPCRWFEGKCMPGCPPGLFGELCNRYCTPNGTCSGNGWCDMEGHCVCYEEWAGSECDLKRNYCAVWGDPHYTAFGGNKFDFHAPGVYKLYSRPAGGDTGHDYAVYGENHRCGGTPLLPMSCLLNLRLTGPDGLRIEMAHETVANPSAQHGKISITPPNAPVNIPGVGNCNPTCFVDADKLKVPLQIGDLYIVAVRTEGAKISVDFELPHTKGMYTKLTFEQDATQADHPYLNLGIEHFGAPCNAFGCVDGICSIPPPGCEGKYDPERQRVEYVHDDCTNLAQPLYPCTAPGECDISNVEQDPPKEGLCNGTGVRWAEAFCCDPYRECAGTSGFEACVVENCHLAWTGDMATSVCIGGIYEEAFLEEGLCEAELCPDGHGGADCDRCAENRTGFTCAVYCSPGVTCNEHGQCSGLGECWCDPEWTGSYGDVSCTHDCTKLPNQTACDAESGPRYSCIWSAEYEPPVCALQCPANYYGLNCDKYCLPSETCSGNGECNFRGECVCFSPYAGSDCSQKEDICTVGGDGAIVTFRDTPAGRDMYTFEGEGTHVLYAKGDVAVLETTYLCAVGRRCVESIHIVHIPSGSSAEVRRDGVFLTAGPGTPLPKLGSSTTENPLALQDPPPQGECQMVDGYFLDREGAEEVWPNAPVRLTMTESEYSVSEGLTNLVLALGTGAPGDEGNEAPELVLNLTVAADKSSVSAVLSSYQCAECTEEHGTGTLCSERPPCYNMFDHSFNNHCTPGGTPPTESACTT
eukprot:Hpha_TRINITY_DN16377_c2_g6::TRINITY_DN16377_c2_g6_i1::g.58124::m.58124